jgi:predicted CopG family antitoxin
MIYKVKRFSQIIEKLFGKSNEPINIVQDVYMETIKLVEMWRSFSDRKLWG